MKCLNDRFVIEPAKSLDGEEILCLLEQMPFGGDISLIYTRREDAYQSFLCEGKDVEVFVCRDSEKDKIISLGAYVIQEVYINNKIENVAYLFGLKGLVGYLRRFPLLHKYYDYLHRRLKEKGVRYCYTTILKENHYTQKLLEKKRKIMPHYEKFGCYETFALRNVSKINVLKDYRFMKASKEDFPAMIEFLNKEGGKYQFFPVVRLKDILNETYKGIHSDSFYMVKKKNEIVAAGAVWDQRQYKQYIVHHYSGILNIFNKLPLLCFIFQLPRLPHPGQMLDFYTLSRWAIKDNDEEVFNFFMSNLRSQTRDYPFMLIGVHESHPLKQQLLNYKHIKYSSYVYFVDWIKKISPIKCLNDEMPTYIECGAL